MSNPIDAIEAISPADKRRRLLEAYEYMFPQLQIPPSGNWQEKVFYLINKSVDRVIKNIFENHWRNCEEKREWQIEAERIARRQMPIVQRALIEETIRQLRRKHLTNF